MNYVKNIIYESFDWTVEKDSEGNLIITHFAEGHYDGELRINLDTKEAVEL